MSLIPDEFKSAQEVHSHIIAKANEDAEFRSALLADPKAAIGKEFDVHLPDSCEISVHESKGTTLHLALPPTMGDLSEEELEELVGGAHGSVHWYEF